MSEGQLSSEKVHVAIAAEQRCCSGQSKASDDATRVVDRR
jgi:hypothetical protein